jgi:small subunit ribosomal protein S16
LAVRIRLTRVGSTKNPIYRIVVVDSRARRDGRAIETIGQYNPQMNPSLIEIDADKAKKWLGEGAQPSRTVKKLLSIKGIDK